MRTIQLQERNHAWHEIRARSMQFTLWILGLAVAASWHLLQEPCDGLRQKLAVTVLVIALSLVSVYFLQALARGTKKNRDALITIETELGLHDAESPTLPKEYKQPKTGWSAHFLTLYALLAVTGLYLLAAIWLPTCPPNKAFVSKDTNPQQTEKVEANDRLQQRNQ